VFVKIQNAQPAFLENPVLTWVPAFG